MKIVDSDPKIRRKNTKENRKGKKEKKKKKIYYIINYRKKTGVFANLPAVSHNPRLTVLPLTTTLALKLSKTVGT